MNWFIEVEDGQVKNHPALEENLIQAFGHIPDHWEPFLRVEIPALEIYQKLDSTDAAYLKINNVWTDVWSIRDMTAEEKISKQQEAKDYWASLPYRDNFAAWVFDETTCRYQPPTPRPPDREVFWQGTTNSWVNLPEYPSDGKEYKLDIASAAWVEIKKKFAQG